MMGRVVGRPVGEKMVAADGVGKMACAAGKVEQVVDVTEIWGLTERAMFALMAVKIMVSQLFC